MEDIKLSLIIPIYNVEKYIHDCLDSLVQPYFDETEIILVNDGTLDNSGKIAEEFAKKYTNVKYVIKENGGLSDARNCGLRQAKGEYVYFIDSDDFIHPNALKSYYDIINSISEIDIICSKADIISENSHQNSINKIGEIAFGGVEENTVYKSQDFLIKQLEKSRTMQTVVWINIYKRDFLLNKKLLFKTGFLHEDEDWTAKVFLNANNIYYLPNVTYYYRKRENSITTNKSKKNFHDLTIIRQEMEYYYKTITCKRLKKLLLDDLVKRRIHDYMSISLEENYKYVKLEKKFLWRNSFSIINKLKILFLFVNLKGYRKIALNKNSIL